MTATILITYDRPRSRISRIDYHRVSLSFTTWRWCHSWHWFKYPINCAMVFINSICIISQAECPPPQIWLVLLAHLLSTFPNVQVEFFWLQWHPPLPQVWSHDPSGTWWRSGPVSRRWRRSVVEWLEMQIHLQMRTLSIGLCTIFLANELGESTAEIIDLFCSFGLLPCRLWRLGGR